MRWVRTPKFYNCRRYILFHNRTTLDEVIPKMELTMDSFQNWRFTRFFNFSENKSTVTFFCKQRDPIAINDIRLCSYTLKIQPIKKCLGLIVDNKLRWASHIENLTQKCKNTLNILRVLTRMNYGMDMKVSITICKQLFLCFFYICSTLKEKTFVI